ncbi:MAG: hypothetical protein U1E14_19570 [Geminicoccaceae bacterium]
MHKLGHLVDGEWREYSQAPLFMAGPGRVIAAVPSGEIAVVAAAASLLTPPLFLLYVLHTPRGEGEPGRYQSDEIDAAELQAFLASYGRFLAADSRFDLWFHSPADRATLVWDRHNLLHAYGMTDVLVPSLRAMGFRDGDVIVPVPHAHYYHAELDELAAALLANRGWNRTPLQPGDEQTVS